MKLFWTAMKETMKLQDREFMMKNFSELIDMVLKNMNGFNIDGWRIKGQI